MMAPARRARDSESEELYIESKRSKLDALALVGPKEAGWGSSKGRAALRNHERGINEVEIAAAES
jgi:hypothetical protein